MAVMRGHGEEDDLVFSGQSQHIRTYVTSMWVHQQKERSAWRDVLHKVTHPIKKEITIDPPICWESDTQLSLRIWVDKAWDQFLTKKCLRVPRIEPTCGSENRVLIPMRRWSLLNMYIICKIFFILIGVNIRLLNINYLIIINKYYIIN